VQVLAKHGADDVVAVFRERFMPEPDQIIRLAPDLAHAHVFDAESGRVLRG
jgi:multiple sugar transport system ATP-binding protein